MRFFEIQERRYAQFEQLANEAGLAHAFCTRPVDVSPHGSDPGEVRAARRRQMATDLGFDPNRLAYCVQAHGQRVAVVENAEQGGDLIGYDAVITRMRQTPLMTFSADCPLVLIFDRRQCALGLVHASWRCATALLTKTVVSMMGDRFGSRPSDLLVGIGPSAGPQEYEVGNDVYKAAARLPDRDRLFTERDGRTYFDLWAANRVQLETAGVPREQIEVAGICTMTRTDLFYSYRREGPGCGHFGLLAGLRG